MPTASLPLPSNILHPQPQTLEFDKIATFIGGNGSGKSTILKSIFDEKLNGTTYEDYKIVCFSSGQNESYSKGFGDYLTNERKKNALNLDCFYYDKLWSKLLIFLATISKQDGEVRSFLRQNNYISENDYEEDESTKLSFNVKVDQTYINRVEKALEDGQKGEVDEIIDKAYHRTLHNFINSLVRTNYDFIEEIKPKNIQLTQEILSQVSFEEDEGALFDSKVMFFTQASDNNYFIVKESFELVFEKDDKTLHLSDLSDGEYQLLFLYSLIDLFDSENTLFLLDEADSHLHYKNIEKLWSIYDKAEGSIITTTHLLDSIEKAGIEKLKVIEKGKIESSIDSYTLLKRLEGLSDLTMLQYKLASMYKNIVLMDNNDDWEIFKLLVKQKLSNKKSFKEIDDTLCDYVCLSVPSQFDEGSSIEEFANNKINWLKGFEKVLSDSFVKNLKTKSENVFLICDGDDFPRNFIGQGKCPVSVNGHSFVEKEKKNKKDRLKNKKKTNNNSLIRKGLVSWKRREIKHYLLSSTALSDVIKTINDEIPRKCYLNKGMTGDYYMIDKEIYNEKLAKIKSDIVKNIVNPHIIENGKGFCTEKAQKYINKIPKEEISEDIENMYNYLVGENE